MEPKKRSKLLYVIPGIIVVVFLFLSLHLAIVYDNVYSSSQKLTGSQLMEILAAFNERVAAKPWEIKYTDSTPKFLGVVLFIGFIIWGYSTTVRKKLISGKEYGTAEWATQKDIAHLSAANQMQERIKEVRANKSLDGSERERRIQSIKNTYTDADMLFTETEKICMYNFELNNNTLIIGGSGSGKTRGFVMPNILQAHSSYIITDPKGEILEKSGSFLKRNGYKIRILNLDEKQLSTGYNPFAYIHRQRPGWEERVFSLIETIIINTDGGEKRQGSDPFWERGEQLFLQSIFFAVAEAFLEEQRNINTVMELIRWLQIEEDEDNYDSDLDMFFKCFAGEFGDEHIAVRQFYEFRSKASGKTAKSIAISSVARLAPFQVEEVRRIFSKDDMHLDRVGEEKTAVFVIVPPIDKTYNFIAGILFTQLFQELNYCALNLHKNDGMRLPVPCRFILDEFANTCVIPNFVEILAYARSLGIGIVVILQSLEQIKKIYEKNWGVVVDNCNTLLYLGKVTHMDTLKYLSELLGKGTYDKRSFGRSRGNSKSSSVNDDRLGRELLDASEVRKIPEGNCLLFISGRNPFYSKKFNYKGHKNYKYTSDADSNNRFIYSRKPEESPHREEKKAVYLPPVPEVNIDVNYNEADIEAYMRDNLLQLDFDEVIDLEPEEASQIYEELERKENREKETATEIAEAIMAVTLNINTEVENVPEEMLADIENVDFDEAEEEQLVEKFLSVAADMDLDDFASKLDSLDLSEL